MPKLMSHVYTMHGAKEKKKGCRERSREKRGTQVKQCYQNRKDPQDVQASIFFAKMKLKEKHILVKHTHIFKCLSHCFSCRITSFN